MPFRLNSIIEYRKIVTTKLMVSVTCTLFLFYQTMLIFYQYMEKNIVTNIKFTKIQFDHIPAITICYDRLYSFERVVNRFDEYKQLYINYTKFIDKLTNDQNKPDYDTQKQAKTFVKAYNVMIEKNFPRFIQLNFGKYNSYLDIFENLTFMLDKKRDYAYRNIYMYFRGKVLGDVKLNDQIKYNKISKIYWLITMPLESINMRYRRKCFTYFSSLEPRFRNLMAMIDFITIGIKSAHNWFPFRETTKVYIAIHSNTMMPDHKSFIEIDQASQHTIIYTKIENQQSVSHAKCTDYDLDYKHGNFNMKSDCVFDCLRVIYDPYCIPFGYQLLSCEEFPVRKTQLNMIVSNKWCNITNKNFYKDRESCMNKCKDECYQAYYLLDSKQTEKETNVSMMMRSNKITITLIPSSLPSVKITHLAEMTFISLLCNFGGLVGMWLGISVLGTLEDVIHLTKNLLIKLYSLTYKQSSYTNNNFFIVTYNATKRKSLYSQTSVNSPRLFQGFDMVNLENVK